MAAELVAPTIQAVTDTKLWRRPLVIERMKREVKAERDRLEMSIRAYSRFMGLARKTIRDMESGVKVGLRATYIVWINSPNYEAARSAGRIISQVYPDVPDDGKEEE